ncbi:aminotransferase class V-fold PLP-dependent enzyme [Tepidiforma flava]|uniref:Aminotransferase class V-fold PLP-dependent enzyme n=1 Tax=Tepidiforma flava TaxID=3004094 RepID=A0ABY7M258_9CHLR|nr:aminotransferase class V-fold PLP-dependent enzyme [Tepidiforma flava]WBL34784.1 aminotransferase class V-fold PLP-dependent enzyme [Tepidiforma flava]
MPIPERGRPWPEIAAEMEAARARDLDWRRGRHGAYVWYASDELEHVLRDAFGMFLVENGLGIRVFPSLARMEADVLESVAALLGGGPETPGIFTSGGTESIFLAVYAMREWARASRPGLERPAVVAPHSAHPALNKAAHYLGLDVRRVPVGPDYRADPAAIAAAVDARTVGLYASAPAYSLGVIDPIADLARLAADRGLWLHVDACVGGILGPFVRDLGYPVPPFAFECEGVTSVSADLHKSGFAAKPASALLFRSEAHREFARYTFDDWPSGTYSGLTFTGTRPGGAIAAAWAAFQFLGREGYRGLAAASMRARAAIEAGLRERIPGLRIHGEPPLYAFAWAAEGVSMGRVAAAMAREGWVAGRTTAPDGIHVMATPVHERYAADYAGAAARAVEAARSGDSTGTARAAYN